MKNLHFFGVYGAMSDGSRLTIDYRYDQVLCHKIIESARHSLVGGFSVWRNARGWYFGRLSYECPMVVLWLSYGCLIELLKWIIA